MSIKLDTFNKIPHKDKILSLFVQNKKYYIYFAIITVLAVLFSIVMLIAVNASIMKIPVRFFDKNAYAKTTSVKDASENIVATVAAIAERNLFRAKLEIELPKPKTEEEIEEEMLTSIVSDLTLKGVWLGQKKGDSYAVIDRGKQKGVWTYEIGEIIEKGLSVSEIKSNAAILKKDEYAISVKLFAKGFEWISKPKVMTAAAKSKTATDASPAPKKEKTEPPKPDLTKEIKTDGNKVIISKALADQIRADNSVIMSQVAIKGSLDGKGKSNGFKIVSVDRGSVAEKIGIRTNDIVQEVNGFALRSSDDLKKAQQTFKNSGKFEVKILRGGQTKTLYYEIR